MCPCVVSISTSNAKRSTFRFENYWLEHQDFLSIVQHGWVTSHPISNPTKAITAKFKNLRSVLKDWQKTLSSLKIAISNIKLVLSFMLFY